MDEINNKDIYIVELHKNIAEYYLLKFKDQFRDFIVKRYKYRLELENGVTITAVAFNGDRQLEDLYFIGKHNARKFRGEDLMERAYQDYIKDLKEHLNKALTEDNYDDEPECMSNFSEWITDIFANRFKREAEQEAREGIPLEEE